MADVIHDQKDPSANVLLFVGNAVKYLEELQNANERNVDEKLKLYFEFIKQKSDAESDRINALRIVDVQNVAIANDRAVKQAEVLANQMAANAEALRASVEKTASTLAQQLALITSQLIERIAALEKAQYESIGRSTAIDPQLQSSIDQLISKTAEIERAQIAQKSMATGGDMTIGKLYAALAGFATVVTILVLMFKQIQG